MSLVKSIGKALARTVSVSGASGASEPPAFFKYKRPGGADDYKRPDTTSYYKRP